ncbi:hypothetical protein FB446DRAFT_707293 [Lentinula raphanica]|nr:hypothetical protein FB446DRAFT_707293 [Lentinula raphanica]
MTGPIHSRCIEDPFKTVRFQSLFILNAATQFDRVIERLNLARGNANIQDGKPHCMSQNFGRSPLAPDFRQCMYSIAKAPQLQVQESNFISMPNAIHCPSERKRGLQQPASQKINSVNFITGMSPGKCGIVIHMAKNGNENELQISHRDGLNPPRHSNKPQDLAESICYESGLWNHFSTNCCTIAQSQGRGSPPPATNATTLFFNMYMPVRSTG